MNLQSFFQKQVPVSTVLIIMAIMAAGPVTCIGAAIAIYAIDVAYDPAKSEIPASNVQGAIDHLDSVVDSQGEAISNFKGPSGPTGPQGATGASGPIGPGHSPKLAIVDLSGNLIGYIWYKENGLTYLYIAGYNQKLFLFSDYCNYSLSQTYYAKSDCTGEAYMDDELNTITPDKQVFSADTTKPVFLQGIYYTFDCRGNCVQQEPPSDMYVAKNLGSVSFTNLFMPHKLRVLE
jgi:hypothetical protein